MNRSSTRGIILSIALLFSVTLILIPAHAEEVTVKSIALDETTVLELTNDSDVDITAFRIWLGSDFSFTSFKTEKGWVGEKTPQGVIIFTSSESIKPGESVKFGVKTDKSNLGINWKALDKQDKQISIGKSIASSLPNEVEDPNSKGNTDVSISPESTFRIVPEKPNIGSTIRVTGEKFGASQMFDVYIDSTKIGNFETNEDGNFMTTVKIPENQNADRADFKIVNKNGEEKKISLRVGQITSRVIDSVNIPLTIQGIPNVIHRGDLLEIFGTGNPNSAVKMEITGPNGDLTRAIAAETDSKGNWEVEPLLVPLDRPFGEYVGVLTDGRSSKTINWTLESDKKIIITPITLKFDQGQTIKFNGTALPGKSIELILEDPLGKEITSDIIQVDESGIVSFEFPTTQNTMEGTYTLIATQETYKEFIHVGIGQMPTIPVNLEFDKLNYKAGDTAVITLSGKASEIISLLIIDPSDKPKGDAISIKLEPDGRGTHTIDLKGYSSGVYTAVISKGSTQSSETFTVGLQTGSGEIDINTTKVDYHPGDSVLILGETSPNNLLTVSMIDPDGKEIKTRDTFSNKNGKISEGSFRIPSDAKPGIWTIKATSGSNFDNTKINVLGVIQEGMVVVVDEGKAIPGFGKTINIHVYGATQTVQIEIVDQGGKVIEELSFPASKSGEINQPWIVPQDTEPGTYTIKASDALKSAETTYKIQ
ncbi:MAG: biofilm-associated protein [Nitrosopumilus sp.]|nr:biofilm-associated protein [Nitrosopumilus sp.]MDH3516874.1 biofilm-associated protein [Nitrosopumilus sp.]MDH3565174.1 biofilm-associated protein [Nitrosopumilus sp.]MDH5555314.1 biofilm-associated protein [Nitrosopumilus sp.]